MKLFFPNRTEIIDDYSSAYWGFFLYWNLNGKLWTMKCLGIYILINSEHFFFFFFETKTDIVGWMPCIHSWISGILKHKSILSGALRFRWIGIVGRKQPKKKPSDKIDRKQSKMLYFCVHLVVTGLCSSFFSGNVNVVCLPTNK